MTASERTHRTVETAIFLAMALVLSWLEHLLPAMPFLPPGVKLGLSNIIVMYCLFVEGAPSALAVAVLKSGFVFLTRGLMSGTLSLFGSLLSVLLMFLFSRSGMITVSYLLLSIIGAISHNLGQLVGVMLFVSHALIYYLPILLISGVIMGAVTGTILRVLMPVLTKLPHRPVPSGSDHDHTPPFRGFMIFFLCLSLLLSGCSKTQPSRMASWVDLFDTYSTFTVYGVTEECFSEVSESLHDLLLRFHRETDIYHTYEGINNLASLNADPTTPLKISDDLYDFLDFCISAYTMTEGKVNVMLGPVTSLWHEARELEVLPETSALQQAAEHTGIYLLLLDKETHTVYLSDPEASIDVGALAKGYAAKMAGTFLEEQGIQNYLLNLGGNINTSGSPLGTDREYYNIAIQDPNQTTGTYAQVVKLTGGLSAVTSGDYQRYVEIDGIRYHHIIDPITLQPSTYQQSVTIVSEDPAICDMLSTALFLMNEEDGKALADIYGAKVYYN